MTRSRNTRAVLAVVLALGLMLSGRGPAAGADDSLKAANRGGLTSRVAAGSAVQAIGAKVAKAWASAVIVGWIAQGVAPPAATSAFLVSQTVGPVSANLTRSPLGPRPPPSR